MARPARLLYCAGVIFLGLLSVCLVVAAVGAAALLRRLGWLPERVFRPVTWGLVSTVGLGLLLLAVTLDDLVRRPARLQQELVGRQLASPWQLRRYETHGFQDAYYEWRYAVDGELLRTLKAKCRPLSHGPPGQCLLAAQEDADWSQEIGLDGDVLWVVGFGH